MQRTARENRRRTNQGDCRESGTVPAVLIACWITILFPPASYLSVVFLILGAFALSQTGKYAWIALIVLLHPAPVFFATGLAAHASGAPYVLVDRSADSLYPRLDYATRGELLSVESRFPWGGWIRLYPHKIAMRLSTRVCGLPEGAYEGPCPGRRKHLRSVTYENFLRSFSRTR